MTAWSSKHPTYREVVERDKGECQRCGSYGTPTYPNQVHHRRIADRRENTHVAERLVVLCCRCHQEVHSHPAISYEDGWLLHSYDRFRCPMCIDWHGDEHGKPYGDGLCCPSCTESFSKLQAELEVM